MIVVPGFENRIIAYINNGNSKFEYREIAHTAHGPGMISLAIILRDYGILMRTDI